nr:MULTISPECIES: hypothetical protein [Mycetohabitans]
MRQSATLDGLNQSAASVFERARIVDRNQRGVVGQCKDGPPLEPRRKLCRRLAMCRRLTTASRELRGQSVRGIRRVPVPLCSSRVPGGSQRDPVATVQEGAPGPGSMGKHRLFERHVAEQHRLRCPERLDGITLASVLNKVI